MSLCPKGVVKFMLETKNRQFEHMFVVCQNLRQLLLFRMDFAQNYRICIDWDHNGASYLRYKGKKVISAWPSGPISNPDHVTRDILHIIDMGMDIMTNKSDIKLMRSTVVTIPPHNITIIPLEPPWRALQCKSVNTELFEVIGNSFLSIEYPYLLILYMLHKFDSRYPEQCVAIAVNVSDEDIILNKGMTLCFVQDTDLTMEIPYVQDMDTINRIKVDAKRKILENSS